MSEKIAVLVSGGVDSSVALARLVEQGHTVEAFYLKIWLEDELSFLGSCPWEEDLSYAQQVCDKLNVPLHVVSMQQEYHDRIVQYTIAEVRAGRTPSPDVWCNRRIKFGAFLDQIDSSYSKIASGHYARVLRNDATGLYELHAGPDAIKDQTYFLSHMTQEQLSRVLFPVGDMTKEEVREKAKELGLATQDRKDSQGICFLGKISFSDFIRHYLGTQDGDILEFESGEKLGTHNGFWFHTIGQRKGLGLSGGPWYVVKKDPSQNIVYVSKDYYSDDKNRNDFLVPDMHWIAGSRPDGKTFSIKMRHGKERNQADIVFRSDGAMHVHLHNRDQGIAAGQFVVLYDGQHCLGSGVISVEK